MTDDVSCCGSAFDCDALPLAPPSCAGALCSPYPGGCGVGGAPSRCASLLLAGVCELDMTGDAKEGYHMNIKQEVKSRWSLEAGIGLRRLEA